MWSKPSSPPVTPDCRFHLINTKTSIRTIAIHLISHRQMASTLNSSTISATLKEGVPQAAKETHVSDNSYGQILKSSAMIGGSSILNIGIGIVRTKFMAIFLGPAGFGLMGLFGSISDLAVSIAGIGINSSGVRQIAESVGTGEDDRIARTVVVLRWTSIILATLGALLLVVFSEQVSTLTFGNGQRTGAVALLSLAVFLRLISAGQGALIQGMRRIGDLSRMAVFSAFFGTLISIPLVYFLREKGVVPSLICIAASMLVTSWWYSRKIQVQPVAMTIFDVRQEAAGLLKLGFAFMASGVLTMGAAYAVRIIVTRQFGVESAGFYQSAWTLGGLYVGIVLQAMGADFFPRLSAIARDNTACNRLVNEQAQISLLLAGPGVLATLTFANVVIALFYSAKFYAAVGILRWICLGMTLRVITWPMSFVIAAKGEKKLFIYTDLAWTIVNIGFSWFCVRSFGLNGAGIAFFGSYVFHGIMIYPIVRRLSGFRWSAVNKRTGMLFLSTITIVFCGFYLLPPIWAIVVGSLAFVLSGVFSIRIILHLANIDKVPRPIQKLFVRFGLAPSVSEK